jgi:hypothetical protein
MAAVAARDGQFPPSSQPPEPGRSPPPHAANAKRFKPGVWIDWARPAVVLAGDVALREGAVEFLACFGGKEHESVFRLDASAADVFLALGLVGLDPGRPSSWDAQARRYSAPTGALVDIEVAWRVDGRIQSRGAMDCVATVEYGRAPLTRPWVFTGSQRLGDGKLAADRTGAGVALVDMPDSLLALAGSHSASSAELWVVANTPVLPEEGAEVWLTASAAAPREYDASLDFRGTLRLNGRPVSPREFSELVSLARRLAPGYRQTVRVEGALRADVESVANALRRCGVVDDALRWAPAAPLRRPVPAGGR